MLPLKLCGFLIRSIGLTIKIERMVATKKALRMLDQRCTKAIRQSGTAFERRPDRHCDRMAVFKLDGKPFCVQHAGEVALKHLIDNQR